MLDVIVGLINNCCSVEEIVVCCCIDVGIIMDNIDCIVFYSCVFDNCVEVEVMLKMLIEKVCVVEFEFCLIEYKLEEIDGGVCLIVDFIFVCQVEIMIF